MLEDQLDLLDLSPLQFSLPWASSNQIPEEAKVSSLKAKGDDPAFGSAASSQNPEHRHPMIPAVKPVPNLHIIHNGFSLFVGTGSISPRQLLNHLCQKFIIIALQKTAGFLCTAVFSPQQLSGKQLPAILWRKNYCRNTKKNYRSTDQ